MSFFYIIWIYFIITRIIKVQSIRMCYDNHQKTLDNLTIKRRNLLEIKTNCEVKEATNGGPETWSLNNKHIVYKPNALRQICELLQHDHRLTMLPFGAIDNIRKLKLNNKPIKNNRDQHQESHQRGSDSRNIVKINKIRFRSDSRIIFATSNVQSIRYKELQVSQLISDYSLDFIVLTETWLNSKQSPAEATYSGLKRGSRRRLSTNQHIPLAL